MTKNLPAEMDGVFSNHDDHMMLRETPATTNMEPLHPHVSRARLQSRGEVSIPTAPHSATIPIARGRHLSKYWKIQTMADS